MNVVFKSVSQARNFPTGFVAVLTILFALVDRGLSNTLVLAGIIAAIFFVLFLIFRRLLKHFFAAWYVLLLSRAHKVPKVLHTIFASFCMLSAYL
jgi:hypothetical protein